MNVSVPVGLKPADNVAASVSVCPPPRVTVAPGRSGERPARPSGWIVRKKGLGTEDGRDPRSATEVENSASREAHSCFLRGSRPSFVFIIICIAAAPVVHPIPPGVVDSEVEV